MAQVSDDEHQLDDHESSNNANDIKNQAEMFRQFQLFFESREKLKERETSLMKRRKLLNETYQKAGKESDVLYLNVGGSKNVAVLRRTLTYFENSMLAAQFSGRWDESLEKDKDGNFFIDQDPNVFLPLLNYLRQCDQKSCHDMYIKRPSPKPELCNMLEYYGLLSSIYPQEWRLEGRQEMGGVVMSADNTNGDSFTISSSNIVNTFSLDADVPLNATSFTAVLEECATAQVGWAVAVCQGKKVGHDKKYGSFGFDLDEREFRANGSRIGNGHHWSGKLPVTIHGTRDPSAKTCSIQVLDHDSDAIIKATFQESDKDMFPHITLKGKVTICNVMYSCEE